MEPGAIGRPDWGGAGWRLMSPDVAYWRWWFEIGIDSNAAAGAVVEVTSAAEQNRSVVISPSSVRRPQSLTGSKRE
jgi:hypothetical protein